MSESLPSTGPESKPPTDRAIPAALERAEQRGHPRFKIEGATALLGKGGFLSSLGLGFGKKPLVNLSQGGVLVLAGKSFPEGTRLRVRIEVPNPADVVEGEG